MVQTQWAQSLGRELNKHTDTIGTVREQTLTMGTVRGTNTMGTVRGTNKIGTVRGLTQWTQSVVQAQWAQSVD